MDPIALTIILYIYIHINIANICKSCKINPDTAGALAGWQLACTAVHFSRRRAYRLPLCFGPLWNLKVHRKIFQLEWPIPIIKKMYITFLIHNSQWGEYLLSNLRTHWKNVDAAISVVKTSVIGFLSLKLVTTQGWHSTRMHCGSPSHRMERNIHNPMRLDHHTSCDLFVLWFHTVKLVIISIESSTCSSQNILWGKKWQKITSINPFVDLEETL